MHIEGASKQCEFRLYESDVCLNSHMLRGVYFKQPWMLMNIYLDLQTMCPELVDIRAAFDDFYLRWTTVFRQASTPSSMVVTITRNRKVSYNRRDSGPEYAAVCPL